MGSTFSFYRVQCILLAAVCTCYEYLLAKMHLCPRNCIVTGVTRVVSVRSATARVPRGTIVRGMHAALTHALSALPKVLHFHKRYLSVHCMAFRTQLLHIADSRLDQLPRRQVGPNTHQQLHRSISTLIHTCCTLLVAMLISWNTTSGR